MMHRLPGIEPPASPDDAPHVFLDRESGRLAEEAIYRRDLFRWSYGTPPGRLLREGLARSGFLHRLVERFADSPLSRSLIGWLIRAGNIDLAEAERPAQSYRSLNAFFTRRLRPGCRPLDPDPDAFVAPADGKLQIFPITDAQQPVVIKGVATRIGDLLPDAAAARRYRGGAVAVLRLYLGDCHRFLFPAAGRAGSPRHVPGRYYAVSPFPGNTVDFYSLNRRLATELASERFGRVAILMVGGFLVSSIRPLYSAGSVARGQEHGCFAFGGSSLVYLTEPGAVRYDEDLAANSRRGLETYVRMGTRIGTGG